MRLFGKTAIVTGAASGIGLAAAHLFAAEGAAVVVADLDDAGAEQAAAAIARAGGRTLPVRVDVSSEASVQALVARAEQEFGALHVLVANAGIVRSGPTDTYELANWQRTQDVLLTGAFLCCKHAIPAMRRAGGGSIVATASTAAHVGLPQSAAYAAAKAGVVALVRTIALEFAADKIRANCVSPSFTRTPMLLSAGTVQRHGLDYVALKHPLGRIAEPEEIARAMLFLASDESSFVTGTTLLADGGFTAQ